MVFAIKSIWIKYNFKFWCIREVRLLIQDIKIELSVSGLVFKLLESLLDSKARLMLCNEN